MQRHFFTFGVGHDHAGEYVEIVCPDRVDPRAAMFAMHGAKWAMQYDEERFKDPALRYCPDAKLLARVTYEETMSGHYWRLHV